MGDGYYKNEEWHDYKLTYLPDTIMDYSMWIGKTNDELVNLQNKLFHYMDKQSPAPLRIIRHAQELCHGSVGGNWCSNLRIPGKLYCTECTQKKAQLKKHQAQQKLIWAPRWKKIRRLVVGAVIAGALFFATFNTHSHKPRPWTKAVLQVVGNVLTDLGEQHNEKK